jgi:hypothetical protein
MDERRCFAISGDGFIADFRKSSLKKWPSIGLASAHSRKLIAAITFSYF